MTTNAWTHRHWRLPRPPVCKSYPRVIPPPADVAHCDMTIQWNLTSMPDISTFIGVLGMTNDGNPLTWSKLWGDDQGHTANASVQIGTGTGNTTLTLDVANFAPLVWSQQVDISPWPQTYPWTSPTGVLLDTLGVPCGTFFIELYLGL